MQDGTWDNDWTKGVHWNPDFAEGHGIWLVDFAPKDVTSTALKDVTSKDEETLKVPRATRVSKGAGKAKDRDAQANTAPAKKKKASPRCPAIPCHVLPYPAMS